MPDAAKEEIWDVWLKLDGTTHFSKDTVGVLQSQDILELVKHNACFAASGYLGQHLHHGL